MFRHASRTDRHNRLLAGYLAFLGGFVNSAGFVLIGSFTSHVTGNVGRFANDLATQRFDAAAAAFIMVAAFLAGAFVASMVIESNVWGSPANAYSVALFAEASILVLFAVVATLTVRAHPRLKDLEAALLCAAMGMQNSLVTRLSGAVVRTTHLTGVVTDIGIEGARWFRWWRGKLSHALRVKLAIGRNPAERPADVKIWLLVTIASTFTAGAMLGSIASVTLRHVAMIFPAMALTAAASYAFVTGRGKGRGESLPPPGPTSRG